MYLSARTYKLLFDLLRQTIASRAFPDSDYQPSLKEITNAEIKIGRKNINISQHFLATSFKYFIDLRTNAKKGNIVTIQDLRFIRAVEFIENTPAEEQYEGHEWAEAAQKIKAEFEAKYCVNSEDDDSDRDELEEQFLKLIAERSDVLMSNKIIKLISDFLNSLNDKRHLDAWHLLSPAAQKKGLWDGDFELFRETFFFFENIKTPPYYSVDFSYEFQTVKCECGLRGNLTTIELSLFEMNFLMEYDKERFRKYFHDRYTHHIQFYWSEPNEKTHDQIEKHISCPLFQMPYLTIWASNNYDFWLGHRFASRKELSLDKEEMNFSAKITCKFIDNRWLIDMIEFRNSIQYFSGEEDFFKM
jgi:hypothetical protein